MALMRFEKVKPKHFFDTGDGFSKNNPIHWYALTDNWIIERISNQNATDVHKCLYFRLKLKAGTTYHIGANGYKFGDLDGMVWLYDESGILLLKDDHSRRSINNEEFQDVMVFTCETDGIYIFAAGSYYEDYENPSETHEFPVACYPQPEYEEVRIKKVVYETSDGFNEFGKPERFRIASEKSIDRVCFVQGFLTCDTQDEYDFDSFKQASNNSFGQIKFIQGKNLNLGNEEPTLVSNYHDYFIEKRYGYIYISEAGDYTFSGQSDDDGALMIDVNGVQHIGKITWEGTYDYFTIKFTEPGYYKYEYYHGEGNGGQIAEVYWTTPSNNSAVSIPADVLFVKSSDANRYSD
jgi:hypothetical protein